ncbi:DUF1542 domain-containing protein, partial [Staphylococcus haemolyticus]|uniref:DUF1542 domain-containing protein n=1 Tax=Staphylococcus haemolyticus TaxID=1283 RepID=UPI0015D924B1
QTQVATEEEKSTTRPNVDEAVPKAKNAIDRATKNDGVVTLRTKRVDTLNT